MEKTVTKTLELNGGRWSKLLALKKSTGVPIKYLVDRYLAEGLERDAQKGDAHE